MRKQVVTKQIATGAVHHLALTVADVERSAAFYIEVLGFQRAINLGRRLLLGNGSVILALTPPLEATQSVSADRFNEGRIGLDHLSFLIPSYAEMQEALDILERHGVEHGEIKDLGADLGLYVLAFRDPDNIQLELTAPYSPL